MYQVSCESDSFSHEIVSNCHRFGNYDLFVNEIENKETFTNVILRKELFEQEYLCAGHQKEFWRFLMIIIQLAKLSW